MTKVIFLLKSPLKSRGFMSMLKVSINLTSPSLIRSKRFIRSTIDSTISWSSWMENSGWFLESSKNLPKNTTSKNQLVKSSLSSISSWVSLLEGFSKGTKSFSKINKICSKSVLVSTRLISRSTSLPSEPKFKTEILSPLSTTKPKLLSMRRRIRPSCKTPQLGSFRTKFVSNQE